MKYYLSKDGSVVFKITNFNTFRSNWYMYLDSGLSTECPCDDCVYTANIGVEISEEKFNALVRLYVDK